MRRGQKTLTGLLMLWLVHPAAASAQQWTARAVAGLNVQVYRPAAAGAVGQGRSLLIVLHGCAQSVDPLRDRGGLNIAAEHHGMVIAVPAVPNGGVVAGCWDYYGDQHTRQNRHNGPVLALVDALLGDAALGIDPDQVYVAGLSSGGGEAAVLACLAPDVFAG
ncbi:MAG: PHB depolymerase family esterase, partial [Myxococcales bacterium]|nr:PHB depolymerase family esterase [Myxococcales bacterium]